MPLCLYVHYGPEETTLLSKVYNMNDKQTPLDWKFIFSTTHFGNAFSPQLKEILKEALKTSHRACAHISLPTGG